MKGWKTVLFNALALTQIPGSPVELLPPKYSIPTMVIGNFILRAVTTTPIFQQVPVLPPSEPTGQGPKNAA